MTNIKWPNRFNQLVVTNYGKTSGQLNHNSQYVFSYDHDASDPVSLTMPFRPESFNRGTLHPIFEMNLPEGFLRKFISERMMRYTKVNDMLFLALQGDKAIGSVGFDSGMDLPSSEVISINDLLVSQPGESVFNYLLERYGLTHSLSGFQPKLLVQTDRTTLRYPNCIVKRADQEFSDLSVNEFVCMTLAKACGLPVPDFYLSDNQELFVIKRFDLKHEQKISFEDFCVLTGRNSDNRYRGSYESLLKLFTLYQVPFSDVELFFRYVVFSCLVGNGDAHLKNFGLLYESGTPRLAPIYDVTCTLYYEHLDPLLALKLNGETRFPNLTGLISFGNFLKIKQPEACVSEFSEIILDSLTQLTILDDFPELAQTIKNQVVKTMIKT